MMKILFKFYGVFKTAANTSEFAIDIAQPLTVRSVIMQLVSLREFQSLRPLLLWSGSSDPRPNALIMISGREINALKGLETMLAENDEVALLPIAHGG